MPSLPNSAPTDDADVVTEVLARARRAFATGRTRAYQWRKTQLHNLIRMLDDHEHSIAAALTDDLGRDPTETWLLDIAPTRAEALFAVKHLHRWMRARKRLAPLRHLPGWTRVEHEPLGVVLIIGAWNVPLNLTLAPLVAALAAGNCAVLKPSECAPATSALLARLLPQYLDPRAVFVVEGEASTTQQLLAQGFDHAFFTGGTHVGSEIMAAAARRLTPVTLELGGKSPVVVAADADLDVAARRILWIKLMNSGQLCIAPDYVLADRTIIGELIDRLTATMETFTGGKPHSGLPIVNETHFRRLVGYLSATEGTIVSGGHCCNASHTIAPTVVVHPAPDEPLMQQEIFGPILPVVAYDSLDEAVSFIRARPKPLAAYVFTRDAVIRERLVAEIPAGGVVVNHVAMHCLVAQLPFGGVGASGTGAYHGRWGFERLSHRKAVLRTTAWPDPRLIYPPYRPRNVAMMRRLF